MQLKALIAEIRTLCKGIPLGDDQLIKWVSALEARIYRETISKYESAPYFSPITDEESTLMIYDEYADVYRYWLLAQIYLYIGDYDKYNTFAELYATALDSFRKDYINKHMPIGTNIKY